jgi:hypothetical protein
MRVRREGLKHDRAVVLVLVVLVKGQFREVPEGQRGARHRTLLVFLDVGHDVEHVVHDALWRGTNFLSALDKQL